MNRLAVIVSLFSLTACATNDGGGETSSTPRLDSDGEALVNNFSRNDLIKGRWRNQDDTLSEYEFVRQSLIRIRGMQIVDTISFAIGSSCVEGGLAQSRVDDFGRVHSILEAPATIPDGYLVLVDGWGKCYEILDFSMDSFSLRYLEPVTSDGKTRMVGTGLVQQWKRVGEAPLLTTRLVNIDQEQIYSDSQVSIPATPTAGAAPRYPESLLSEGVEGRVIVQFVVDTLGYVEPGSLKVIQTDHELFSEVVNNALQSMRFLPAEISHRKVRQSVRQPFVFDIGNR